MIKYLYTETYEVKKYYCIYANNLGDAQKKVNEDFNEPDSEEETLLDTEMEQDEP